MRGPDGETPRGTGGEPERMPLYRPPWSRDEPDLPWYKRVTRRQWYLIAAIIVTVHGVFGWGFFWQTNFSRAERMRNTQKVMMNYQTLPSCYGPRVDGESLVASAPIAVPDIVKALRLKGTVGLGVRLKPDGSVLGACLAESSGNPGLDNALYAAARNWRFQLPAQNPEARRLLSLRITEPAAPIEVRAWTPPAKIPVQSLPQKPQPRR